MDSSVQLKLERKKAFLIRFFWFLAVVGIAVFLCRKALGTLMPVLISFLVAAILQPVIRLLRKKLHFPRGLATSLCVILFYLILGVLLVLLGSKLFTAVRDLVMRIPSVYSERIEPMLNGLSASIRSLFERVDPNAASYVDALMSAMGQSISASVSNLSVSLVKTIGTYAISVPSALLKIMLTVIGTMFVASDLAGIKRWVLAQFNTENRTLLQNIFLHLKKTLLSYIKGYGLIMTITFVELCIGLWLIGIENWALVSFAIAVLDILPVVGCGTVLIPWSIICLFNGEYRNAIGIAILYVVILIIRNYIEPKIVGSRVGLHPIVTLAAMIIGTAVFGGIGLLGLPITIALLVSLNEAGAIKLFKSVHMPDFSENAAVPAGSEAASPDGAASGAAESAPKGDASKAKTDGESAPKGDTSKAKTGAESAPKGDASKAKTGGESAPKGDASKSKTDGESAPKELLGAVTDTAKKAAEGISAAVKGLFKGKKK